MKRASDEVITLDEDEDLLLVGEDSEILPSTDSTPDEPKIS